MTKTTHRLPRVAPILIATALLLLGVSRSSLSQERSRVRIFAAASLTDALSAVVTEFETAHPGVEVVPQFGSSSDLARQILAGAPADLLFSADTRQVERLAAQGRVDSQVDILSNQLVIVRHRDRAKKINGPVELEGPGRIAMADPEAVPAGVYSKQYLESIGLWSRLRGKIVPTLDVRGALAAVASGNLDAGFVYRTDAAIEDRVEIVYEVPLEEGPPIRYRLARLEDAVAEAGALFEYLQSPSAGEILTRFGFIFLP